jgi:hypothetical protein
MASIVQNELVVAVEQNARLGIAKIHFDFERGRVALFDLDVL